MNRITQLITMIVTLAISFVPMMDKDALAQVERGALVPQADRDRLLQGMSHDDRKLGQELFQRLADAISDLVVFLASRGKVRPD